MSRVWLISGCSSGIGREIALAALAQGDRVGVTARDTSSVADIVDQYPETAVAITLDVTRAEDIEKSVSAVLTKFSQIDVLVNNAGYGYLAAIEEGDEASVRAMFETNFFGVLALTRAVLPHMRARRSGRIINVSSQAGLMGNPGTGYYSSSKYAVEGLTEALSKEVAPLNIRVSAVQPGPFRTDWAGRSMQMSGAGHSDYKEQVGDRLAMISQIDGHQPGDPIRAAAAILALSDMAQPPAQLMLGSVVLDTYRQKLESLQADIDTHEQLTRSADYPSEEL